MKPVLHKLNLPPNGPAPSGLESPPSESALDKQVGGDHYKRFKIQPGVFCHVNKLGFFESLAIRYATRHRFKNGKEDLEKAIHCLQLAIELEYPEERAQNES